MTNEMSAKDFQNADKADLPIFVKWMDFVKWLVITVERLPKKVRFTLSDRMINLALDIVENLVEARYSQSKARILREANLRLEKMRILIRICFESQLLSHQSYKHAIILVNETGRMLGGWIKQQRGGQ